MSNKQEVNQAALLEKVGARLKIVTRPIPSPGPNEILVRNHAIAANPVDYKIQDAGAWLKNFPTIVGSDGCGVVAAVGSAVTKFKVGDRVMGFAGVIYLDNPDHGAWQTYMLLKEIVTAKIPDFMSFEEGSTFPMAFATSSMALFVYLGLPLPKPGFEPQKSAILIWGASSSIGTAGVQLAKRLGLKIFATASPTHHGYIKSLGASEVFDYRDADVVSKIVAAASHAGTPITLAYDTVGEGTTSKQSAEVVLTSGGKGGKLVLAIPWSSEHAKPEDIEITQTGAYLASTQHADIGTWLFNDYLPKEMEEKRIVAAPRVEIVEGGIEAAQQVFDKLKAGVSGKKLVVKVK